ncbi:hypothetical protein ACNBFH_004447 [Salmonella enterica subsp. enterica serovar Bareilly]
MFKPEPIDRESMTARVKESARADIDATFESITHFATSSGIALYPQADLPEIRNAEGRVHFALHKIYENEYYMEQVIAAAEPHKQHLANLQRRLHETQHNLTTARAARRSALADGTAAGMSSGEVAAMVDDVEMLKDLIAEAEAKLTEFPLNELEKQIGIGKGELETACNDLRRIHLRFLARAFEGEMLRVHAEITKLTPVPAVAPSLPLRLYAEGRPAPVIWAEWQREHGF